MKRLFLTIMCAFLAVIAGFGYVTENDIVDWSNKHELTDLLVSIAKVESSLDETAISSQGAMGLYQFMPITVLDLAQRWNYYFSPFNPEDSTKAAIFYLEWLFEKLDGDLDLVLTAWNWGYGNVRKHQRGEIEIPTSVMTFTKKVKEGFEWNGFGQ